MGFVFFRTTIEDDDKWKPVFDDDAADRKAAGSGGGQLFRDDQDANVVYILFDWDLEKAREFGQSERLAKKMQQGGVLGPPDIFFMNEVEKLSS